jgi:LAO/AO transport system kinase
VREARRDLEQMMDLSMATDWRPPVVETDATSGEGVAELWEAIARHRGHLLDSGLLEARRAERLDQELRRMLVARLLERLEPLVSGEGFAEAVRGLAEGRLDPYEAADRLLEGQQGRAL